MVILAITPTVPAKTTPTPERDLKVVLVLSIEYLTDQNGQTKAVVIPIELWRQVFPQEDMSCEEFTEAIEDYCLNQAMDEAQQSPLLAIEEALAYLEE